MAAVGLLQFRVDVLQVPLETLAVQLLSQGQPALDTGKRNRFSINGTRYYAWIRSASRMLLCETAYCNIYIYDICHRNVLGNFNYSIRVLSFFAINHKHIFHEAGVIRAYRVAAFTVFYRDIGITRYVLLMMQVISCGYS